MTTNDSLSKPSLLPTLVCMDSGVGGLAVLHEFARHLPQAPYLFVGDTAWMPYGEKPLSAIHDRVLAVHQTIDTMVTPVAFVLACNTATVATYEALQTLHLPYPVLEPVQTTAQFVNQTIQKPAKIGVLATPGTVESNRYGHLLNDRFEVLQIPCKGLASIIESGHANGPQLEAILQPYLEPLKEWGVEVIVSGCTHYAFISEAIHAYFPWPITLIDSAHVLAQQALPILEKLNLPHENGKQEICVTGNSQAFRTAMNQLALPAFQNTPVTSFLVVAQESSLTIG